MTSVPPSPMSPDQAAWVRTHAWTEPVHGLFKPPRTARSGLCQCQRPFTSAPCAGGSCESCDAPRIFSSESVLVGPDGWIYAPGQGEPRAMWVLLKDRWCFTRCNCSCHSHATPPTPPTALAPGPRSRAKVVARPGAGQLDLFAGVP